MNEMNEMPNRNALSTEIEC